MAVRRHVVLVGAGHTHLHVLLKWSKKPPRDASLTLVSDFPTTAYSGMLPGTLAGLYPADLMQIDLARLAAHAHAEFVVARTTGLDRTGRRLLFADRAAIPFVLLSLGLGSIPSATEQVKATPAVVPIKPMQTFIDRLDARLEAARSRPLHVAIVGGGAGGVEVTLCLVPRLARLFGDANFRLAIFDSRELLPGYPDRARQFIYQELAARGVEIHEKRAVTGVRDEGLQLAGDAFHAADVIIWATGAAPPPLLSRLGLPLDDHGFLLVRPTLGSVAGDSIFAVGDCATIAGQPVAKAGVYAVRQGPVLWENINRALEGDPLVEYKPQRSYLSALALGDGRAVLAYRGFALRGRWCWRVKDAIDRRWIGHFRASS